MLAAHIVAGNLAVLSYMPSVPVFMLVLLLAAVCASGLERAGVSSLRPLLMLQLLALIAFLALGVTVGPWGDADAAPAIVAGMCGVAAMAVQNALGQISLKSSPTTAVMTMNLMRLIGTSACCWSAAIRPDSPRQGAVSGTL